jgi:hypothetical protein
MSKIAMFFAVEFAVVASVAAVLVIHSHTVASAAGI